MSLALLSTAWGFGLRTVYQSPQDLITKAFNLAYPVSDILIGTVLILPWMTLLTASAGDVYSALSGHELDILQTSLTAALALLLTVNMIIERKEFLEMLTEIEESHSLLRQEFTTALTGFKRFSASIRDAEKLDINEVRRMAADVHRDAERLDRMIEEMVAPEDQVRGNAGVAIGVAVASRDVRRAQGTEVGARP